MHSSAEAPEQAGDYARHLKKARITPRRVLLGIRNSEELENLQRIF